MTAAGWQALAEAPLWWLALTTLVYLAMFTLYRRSRLHPLLIPVMTSVLVVLAVLALTGTPYADYARGTAPLTLMIGPATVLLAVPLYHQWPRLRAIWRPVALALLVGCTTAIVSAVGIAWALGGSWETLASLAPKSATMPIAMPVAERAGGLVPLAAVAVAITGIFGTMVSQPLLRWLRVEHDPVVRGVAVGLTAHAIGMVRELQGSPVAGAFAALAMGLSGLLTSVLVPLLLALVQR